MTKKEKFLQLVSNQETETLARVKERKQNRAFIRRSQEIALAILDRLDSLNWSQKRLAEEMGVTPQLVNKWVRGGENFTLETLSTLENALNTSLISVQLQDKKFQSDNIVTASANYKTIVRSNAVVLQITHCIKEQSTYMNKRLIAN